MKTRTIIAAATATAAIITLYTAIDPATAPWFPFCPLYHLTGIQCPLCGGQRMLHALLNGDLCEALRQNGALLVTLPFWVFLAAAALFPKTLPRANALLLSKRAATAYLLAAALWMIIRNLR
ncbi:MAG: DUF2752 domain-containing protein [Bacteroidaceae bacterium]|nr:DUF2752 domain-containing protein [Bacteroidaceae bacterium]